MKNRSLLSAVPWSATALLASAQLFSCFEPPGSPQVLSGEGGRADESQLAVLNVEPEVQEAFDNAAYACDAYLVEPAAKSSDDPTPEWAANVSNDACVGAPRPTSYAAKYTVARRQGRQCTTGALPSAMRPRAARRAGRRRPTLRAARRAGPDTRRSVTSGLRSR